MTHSGFQRFMMIRGNRMKKYDLNEFTISNLFKYFAYILDELKERNVIRTRNNPVADYAEWLVAKSFDLSLERNSRAGYDAINNRGERFQIKSRRLDPTNKSRQLSVIRNLKEKEFDYLIGVLFEKEFTVKEAYKIPHKIIENYARFSKHQNGHILNLKGRILEDPKVKNITQILISNQFKNNDNSINTL